MTCDSLVCHKSSDLSGEALGKVLGEWGDCPFWLEMQRKVPFVTREGICTMVKSTETAG